MNKKEQIQPWLIVPVLYFAQGIPFVIVNQLSAAMYKSFDVSNAFIGLTSFLYLPWSFKFLWGPIVDGKSTKRNWILWMELCLTALFALNAFFIRLNGFVFLTLLVFTITAFISATHDIAIDGFYLLALDRSEQALFVGIRSAFYRLAMIFAGGLLVSLAGVAKLYNYSLSAGWSFSFVLAALVFAVTFIYNKKILPFPQDDKPVINEKSSIPFWEVFREYFSRPKIGIIVSFILLYRLGEGLLLKMAQPFLLDNIKAGGMGLTLTEVGFIYGTFGVLAMVAGGIFGGWLIKKIDLKKLIWPLAFSIHLPNLLYVYLASVHPESTFTLSVFGSAPLSFHPIVFVCITIEQFGYGLGFSSFMVYLLYISKGQFKTSHYAISTGLMAIGMMLPGFVSGVLQQNLGYLWLFILSSIATIPGMLTIFFLPFDEKVNEA